MRVQLLVFPGCPHADAARAMLERVLASAPARAQFEEVDTTAAGTPEPLRGWASPTILIDGEDIEGQQAPAGEGCRVYRGPDGGLQGVPSEATLRAALSRAATR